MSDESLKSRSLEILAGLGDCPAVSFQEHLVAAYVRSTLEGMGLPVEADRYGNLVYNKTARNFAPIMAMAANTTIVQTSSWVEAGAIDPEIVVTPGIFVDCVVTVPNPAHESRLVAEGRSYP